jgi:hypothetical protein
MAASLSVCNKVEQRAVIRFLLAEGQGQKYIADFQHDMENVFHHSEACMNG